MKVNPCNCFESLECFFPPIGSFFLPASDCPVSSSMPRQFCLTVETGASPGFRKWWTVSKGWAKDLEPGQVPCLALPIDAPEDCLAQWHWHTFSSLLQQFHSADKKNTSFISNSSVNFTAALLRLIENAQKIWIFFLFYWWGCAGHSTNTGFWGSDKSGNHPEILKLALQTAFWSWQCWGPKGNKMINYNHISLVDTILFPDQRGYCCRVSGPLTGVEWKAPCSFLLLAQKQHKWAVEPLLTERIKLHDYPGQTITWITADHHCGVLCSTALALA